MTRGGVAWLSFMQGASLHPALLLGRELTMSAHFVPHPPRPCLPAQVIAPCEPTRGMAEVMIESFGKLVTARVVLSKAAAPGATTSARRSTGSGDFLRGAAIGHLCTGPSAPKVEPNILPRVPCPSRMSTCCLRPLCLHDRLSHPALRIIC